MTALRFCWAVLTWIAYEVVFLPLVLLGPFVVPVAIRYRVWRTSAITGRLIATAPRALHLWGNEEDGYAPDSYGDARRTWSLWRRMFTWAAIRNPVGNLRFVRALHPPPQPWRIRILRGRYWVLIWQGAFYRLELSHGRWWLGIGWKYRESDATAVAPDDWRRFGVGFGLRLKRAA
ncbi:MAG: hypothetical protein IT480_06425 [Gammaproteobacteria bacterium]|nr:hypothetical protein [Gammaproteobacteria bacterium]